MIELALQAVRRGGLAPAAVFILHVVLTALRAYDHVPAADVPMHVGGGFAIASFFWRGLALLQERGLAGRNVFPVDALFVLGLTGTAAVVWELYEFTIDALGWLEAQNGLADTMADLVLGMLGGAAFLAFRRWRSASDRA